MLVHRDIKSVFTIVLVALLLPAISYGWGEKRTHGQITKYAAMQSVLSPDHGDFMLDLGFALGLDTSFVWDIEHDGEVEDGPNKTILEWMSALGARYEDNELRLLNHFFHPLKTWSDAGLWGMGKAAPI